VADTLKIAKTASSAIDLLGSDYEFVELDQPAPQYDSSTRASCSGSGSKVTRRQLASWSIPLTIYCLGTTGSARFGVRDALLAELERAALYEVGATDHPLYDGMPRYLVRAVDNQTPDYWQIMDYRPSFPGKRSDNKFVTLAVELVCWPGQKFPENVDTTGFSFTYMLGGIGRYLAGGDGFPAQIGGI
jgi:hypothetical protein